MKHFIASSLIIGGLLGLFITYQPVEKNIPPETDENIHVDRTSAHLNLLENFKMANEIKPLIKKEINHQTN